MSTTEFRHEAMATYFEITVSGQDRGYAGRAAAAAFRELDRLEGELSRYVESSDISRANRLARGDSTVVGDDAIECLLTALGVWAATAGAFDPAYASERTAGGTRTAPAFSVDHERHRLTSLSDRLHLDLGAVGKGYALDRMAAVLGDWGVDNASLNSGGSTLLGLGDGPTGDGWLAAVGEAPSRVSVGLTNAALSGSGVAVKGSHIVDPRSGARAARSLRAWSHAPVAALADALSTAFFVMADQEVRDFCGAHEGIGAALTTPSGAVERLGTLAACG